MPGPQSTAPKPVVPSRPRRRFSVEQANKTLPLVSRVVGDIVRTHNHVDELQEQLIVSTSARQQQHLQEELERQADRMQSFLDELQDIGCELKDFGMGLVDFIGRHQGRDVHLCWMLGEEKIGYWHELTAGFAGRQPIAKLQEDDA